MGKLTNFLDNITGQNKENSTKVVQVTQAQNGAGRYFLFRAKSEQEYLKFLEVLDESKYKIVDISISVQVGALATTETYMVTYKKITKWCVTK